MMPLYSRKSVTFIELLIAIILLAGVVLAINNLNIFSRYHLVSADRRVKTQNDVSYILDHMTKNITNAIGNTSIDDMIHVINNPNDASVEVFIDANGNGQKEASINNPGAAVDHWIAYRYDATGGVRNQIRYCPRCRDDNCNFAQCMDAVDVLSRKITNFTPAFNSSNNYVDIQQITACWDPTASVAACGTSDNPSVTMSTSISLPSISSN